MDLSEYQLKVLELFTNLAPRTIARSYTADCSIVATRVTMEVLKKFHFKDVKPLVVTASIFNNTYVKKGRTPQSDEEAQAWLAEGAWQVVVGDQNVSELKTWPGHLVAVVNGKYVVDLAITHASRPNKNIKLPPVAAIVPESLAKEKDQCGLLFNDCLVVYVSSPQDIGYQKARDWWDKKKSDEVVKEIYEDIKHLLKGKK